MFFYITTFFFRTSYDLLWEILYFSLKTVVLPSWKSVSYFPRILLHTPKYSILSFQDCDCNVNTSITYVSGYWNKEYFYKSPYKSFFIILIHDISRKNCSLQFSINLLLIYIFTDFKTLLVSILVVAAHTLKGVNWTLNSY